MELLVAALVVVGLLLVAGRFLLRSESGEIVLPAFLDESVGLWALRRITGLRLWEREEPAEGDGPGTDAAPSAPAARQDWPIAPSSTAVAWPDRDPNARYGAARRSVAAAAAAATVARPAAGPSTTIEHRWPNRLAALLALVTVLMIAITVVGLTILPREDPGVGLPGRSAAPGGSAVAVAPGSAGPGGSATASGSAAASGFAGSSNPDGSAAPSAGVRSSPAPGSSPGGPPPSTPLGPTTPPATPAPTPTRAPTPAPTPTPTPLKASVSCSATVLLATCDGSASTGATTYRFDFGDGSPAVSGPSSFALHTYLAPGSYTVILTVGDGNGHSATDTTSLTIGP